MGWAPIRLCQTYTLKHYWQALDNEWAAVPTRALWVCDSDGWPYLPGNWTGRCNWGWPYLPAQVQRTLVIQPTIWEAFKCDTK